MMTDKSLPSKRMQMVQDPIIMVVWELSQKVPDTISLGQGIVYYGPPKQAKDRIDGFFDHLPNHIYHAVQGNPPLIEKIREKLLLDNQTEVGADRRVIVTAGGNLAFSHSIFAITDPGDEVILMTPYYFNHEMAIRIAGCRPVCVPTDEHYQLDLNRIEAAIGPKTRAIVTVSPNNPTGVIYPESDLRAVNALCKRNSLYHIHDEAYEYFTYEGVQAFSPGAIEGSAAHTIGLYSLSKSYGFASWRIGYMYVPVHLYEAISKIQDTHLICPTVISQHAALGAMEAGKNYALEKRKQIEANRKLFQQGLSSLGDACFIPESQGAFYFLLQLQSRMTDMDIVKKLISDYSVAVIPGNTFGIPDSPPYLRIAYGAVSSEQAEAACDRLVKGLKSIL